MVNSHAVKETLALLAFYTSFLQPMSIFRCFRNRIGEHDYFRNLINDVKTAKYFSNSVDSLYMHVRMLQFATNLKIYSDQENE